MVHAIVRTLPVNRASVLLRFLVGMLALVAVAGFIRPGAAVAQNASPEAVVKNLYAAHNNGRGKVFTKQSKETLHRFFDKKLADLIWKELNHQPEDEVGNLDFDPLFNSQDVQVSKLKVGKAKVTGNKATVVVTFDNYGKLTKINFPLVKTGSGWRIQNLIYEDGSTLIKILSAPHN